MDFLVDLLDAELTARRVRCLKARTRLAHLPFHQTLEEFDFSFQPSVDERQMAGIGGAAKSDSEAGIPYNPPAGKEDSGISRGIWAV